MAVALYVTCDEPECKSAYSVDSPNPHALVSDLLPLDWTYRMGFTGSDGQPLSRRVKCVLHS